MSKLILGTVQFGLDYGINNTTGRIGQNDAFDILNLAFESGINTIDTAASYGVSEKVLGDFFSQSNGKNFKIITKFKLDNQDCEASLLNSLENLKVNSVDTLLFHSFEDYYSHRSEIPNLLEKYKGIFFDRLGVSIYTNKEIESVIKDTSIEVVQAPFNLLDNEFQRAIHFNKVKSAGKELLTRSVFLQGLFFKNTKTFPHLLTDLEDNINRLQSLAKDYGLTMSELALSYVLSKEYVDGVLIGVDNIAQLIRNISESNTKLSIELIKKIDSIIVTNVELLNPSKWQMGKP